MIIRPSSRSGLTLIEVSVTTALAGIIALVTYALLNISFILAAKNIAINTTHQQARYTTLKMLRDFRSAVSVPQLADDKGIPLPSPAPAKAAGIAFQKWASGPYAIKTDVKKGETVVHVALLSNQRPPQKPLPIYYPPESSTPNDYTQKLIIPTHQIEEDITGISVSVSDKSDVSITLKNAVKVDVLGTDSKGGHIVCFITDKCSYTVSNNALYFHFRSGEHWSGDPDRGGDPYQKTSGTGVTNATPFYLLIEPDGATDGAAFNSLFNDLNSSNRRYRSLQISLNGEAPMKAQLTTGTPDQNQ